MLVHQEENSLINAVSCVYDIVNKGNGNDVWKGGARGLDIKCRLVDV